MTIKQLIEEVTIPTFEMVKDLQTRKGADYSGQIDTLQNLKNSAVVGITYEQGVLVRIMDKISRISTLLVSGKDPQVADEKLDDTINDLIVYSILLKALRHERNLNQQPK